MLLLLPLFVTNLQIAAAASSADSSGDDGSTSRDDPGVGADPPGAGDDGGVHLPRTCVRRGLARGWSLVRGVRAATAMTGVMKRMGHKKRGGINLGVLPPSGTTGGKSANR